MAVLRLFFFWRLDTSERSGKLFKLQMTCAHTCTQAHTHTHTHMYTYRMHTCIQSLLSNHHFSQFASDFCYFFEDGMVERGRRDGGEGGVKRD